MPFSQQYAFVFADKFNSDGRFIKTSAHELAHGIFNLEHQYKFHAGIDTFATPNLMTYHPTATNLNKYQWDRVQNPLDRGYHDAGDEGLFSFNSIYLLHLINGIKYAYAHNDDDFELKVYKFSPSLLDERHLYASNFDYEIMKSMGVNSENENSFSGNIIVNPNIEWDTDNPWTKGLNFELSNSKNFRLYTYPNDDLNNFKDYIANTTATQWKTDFQNILKLSDTTELKFFLASYPVEVYKKIDKNLAEIFLDTLIRKNWAPSYMYEGAIFEKGDYKKYLCNVTRYLLNKYYDYTCTSCEDFDEYKDLDDFAEKKGFGDKYENVMLNNVQWVSQFDNIFSTYSCWSNACCYTTSNYILNQTTGKNAPRDASNNIAVLTSPTNYNQLTATDNFENRLEYLENQIVTDGEPVVIGVHYYKTSPPINANEATRHFMIIVGKGYDEVQKSNYFRFFEVGTNVQYEDTRGRNELNRLYVNRTLRTISGQRGYDERFYTVTEIRESK